jgi:hypothetical protein
MGSRSSPLYDFLNAKYVIARKDVDLDWTKFVPVFDGDPDLNVYLNRNALPRAFAVYQATVVPDQKAAFEAVHQPGFDPSRRAVIEGGRELPPFEGEPSGTVQVMHYALNHIDLAVDMPAAGYLVLSEVAYPGWEARVDGRVSLLYRANFAFRAVYLERGSHQVSLAFRPLTWYLGLGISGVTLALLAGWALVACRRHQ